VQLVLNEQVLYGPFHIMLLQCAFSNFAFQAVLCFRFLYIKLCYILLIGCLINFRLMTWIFWIRLGLIQKRLACHSFGELMNCIFMFFILDVIVSCGRILAIGWCLVDKIRWLWNLKISLSVSYYYSANDLTDGF